MQQWVKLMLPCCKYFHWQINLVLWKRIGDETLGGHHDNRLSLPYSGKRQ